MGSDEKEGRAEEREANPQRTLGLELRHDARGHCGIFHLCGKREAARPVKEGSDQMGIELLLNTWGGKCCNLMKGFGSAF